MEPQNHGVYVFRLALLVLAIAMAAATCQAVITPDVERLLLRQKWDSAFAAIADDTNNVNDPVSRMISVNCCIALNRNGDVHVLTDATFKAPQLKAWSDWTSDFLARNPGHPVALCLSSDAICRYGFFTSKSDSALQISADRATDAIRADSTFAMAWLARGISHQYLRMYDKSLEDLSQAIKRRGDFAEAYFYKALSLERKEDMNGAIAAYTDALSKNSDFPRAWVFRGAVYQSKGVFDSALSDCTKALEYDSKYAIAHLVKAQTYEKMQRPADAITEYTAFVNEAGEVWRPQVARAKRQLETLQGK
jgi:tetratricopeptide (TPR) repeat protein